MTTDIHIPISLDGPRSTVHMTIVDNKEDTPDGWDAIKHTQIDDALFMEGYISSLTEGRRVFMVLTRFDPTTHIA